MPIWGPHHNDVDLNTFEPVDAVHPRALDRHLAFERHAERGEKTIAAARSAPNAEEQSHAMADANVVPEKTIDSSWELGTL